MKLTEAVAEKTNYLFLGEAGCGKSEIALNLALGLAAEKRKPVHFFDLDMTKPLFRSRDVADVLEGAGVTVHFQEQYMDAPTQVGGPRPLLRSPDCITVLDVGGDYIGASAVGIYAPLLLGDDTAVYYVVNPFRPWSMTLEHIDGVLSQVLGAAKLPLDRLSFAANPNLGIHTAPEDIRAGLRQVQDTVGQYVPIAFGCVWEALPLPEETPFPLAPLHLYLTSPWEQV